MANSYFIQTKENEVDLSNYNPDFQINLASSKHQAKVSKAPLL